MQTRPDAARLPRRLDQDAHRLRDRAPIAHGLHASAVGRARLAWIGLAHRLKFSLGKEAHQPC
jgi:hypothetical protein